MRCHSVRCWRSPSFRYEVLVASERLVTALPFAVVLVSASLLRKLMSSTLLVFDIQEVFGEWPDTFQSLREHSRRQIATGISVTTDVGALQRAPWLVRFIRAMTMPHGTVVENQRARRTASRNDLCTLGCRRCSLRARYKARGAIFRPKFINHVNEPQHRKALRIAGKVHVEFLR